MKKRILLGLAAFALFAGSLAFSLNAANPISVHADGETSEPISSESLNQSDEEKTGVVVQVHDWYENKVVPILGGVSVATVVGIAVSIITAITKAKGDKTNRSIITAQDAKILELNGIVENLKVELEKSHEFEAKMLENYQNTLSQTTVTMEQVSQYAKTTAELVATQNGKIEKVERMKDVIDASVELTAKSFALSDVAVKSGIAKDAQRLVEALRGGNSDGGKN